MALELTRIEVLTEGLDHPEGVAYAPDGNLYATGEAGQVYRITPAEGKCVQIASTGGFGLGLAADADANLYVCDMGVHAVVRVEPSGATSTYSRGSTEDAFVSPNYPVFDAHGNLYVSDCRQWGQNNGLISKIYPDGRCEVWSRSAHRYTNGMAMGPDSRYLYVAESTLPGVSRIAILPDGSAGEYEVVVHMPETVPDGLAFDADGNLYISCFAPDRIYRLSPSGDLETLFSDWERRLLNAPTNLAFAGPGLEKLAIAGLGGYAIVWASIDHSGLPLHYPKL